MKIALPPVLFGNVRVAPAALPRRLALGLVLAGSVGLAYAAGSQLAYMWFNANGIGAAFFPAAGVTLCALVLTSRRLWPFILLGTATAELLIDRSHGLGLGAAAGYALANTVEPVVGAALLLGLFTSVDLGRVRCLLGFLVCAVVLGPAVGSLIGTTTFALTEDGSNLDFAAGWWVGDGLGVLVVAATALSLATATARMAGWRQLLEILALAVSVTVTTGLVFWVDRPVLAFVPVSLLLVTAFRLGTFAVALASAGMAFAAAQATAGGHVFWESLDISASAGIIYLQLVLGFLIATVLLLAAALSGRDAAVAELAVARDRGLLAQVKADLARTSSPSEIHSRLVSHLAATLGALDCSIYVRCQDGVLRSPDDPEASPETIGSREIGAALASLLQTRTKPIVAERSTFPDSEWELLATTAPATAAAFAALPLTDELEADLGALVVWWANRPNLVAERLVLAEEIAARVSTALARVNREMANAQQQERADRARERTSRLHRFTSAIAEVRDEGALLGVLSREVLSATGAARVVTFMLESDGEHLRLAYALGPRPDDYDDRWARVPLSVSAPSTDTVRSGRVLVMRNREELHRRLGARASWVGDEFESGVSLPVDAQSGTVGVLQLVYLSPLDWEDEEDETAFLLSIGRQSGLALERARSLAQESTARRRAELLTAVLSGLESVGGFERRAERLVELIVPRIADYASVAMLAEQDRPIVSLAQSESAPSIATMRELSETQPSLAAPFSSLVSAATLVESTILPDITPAMLDGGAVDERSRLLLSLLAPRSQVTVPLTSAGDPVGVLILGLRDPQRRPYDDADLGFFQDLASRVGTLLENARLEDDDRRTSLRLQQALLPDRLPNPPGIRLATLYAAAHERLAVGGDWYDVVAIGSGQVAIAVGDVVGHGLESAATMGQLRTALAAFAVSEREPAPVLDRLDAFAANIPAAHYATVAYGMFDPATNRLRYALAGHPAPVLLPPREAAVLLDDGRSTPLCAATVTSRAVAEIEVPPGSTLIFYTDGLVERRDCSLDERLAQLLSTTEQLRESTPREMCDELLQRMTRGTQSDDVAILCLQFESHLPDILVRRVPADPTELAPIRRELRLWLDAKGVDEASIFDLLLAVGEAHSNAVEHAYPDGDGEIEIKLSLTRANGFDPTIDASVRDWGTWKSREQPSDRGRGIEIIGALVDSVHVDRHGNGTCTRFTRGRLGIPR